MRHLLPLLSLLAPLLSVGQWTYQGTYGGIPVQLDSVRVTNLSRLGSTAVLEYDSLGQLILVGIEDQWRTRVGESTLLPGRPNPFFDHTTFGLSMPKAGNVTLMVFDAVGRSIVSL